MPRAKSGQHNLHVKVSKRNFRILQTYCIGGLERISASSIIDLFLEHYIEEYLTPRLADNEAASRAALEQDIPKATKLVAHLIEPSSFEAPTQETEQCLKP